MMSARSGSGRVGQGLRQGGQPDRAGVTRHAGLTEPSRPTPSPGPTGPPARRPGRCRAEGRTIPSRATADHVAGLPAAPGAGRIGRTRVGLICPELGPAGPSVAFWARAGTGNSCKHRSPLRSPGGRLEGLDADSPASGLRSAHAPSASSLCSRVSISAGTGHNDSLPLHG